MAKLTGADIAAENLDGWTYHLGRLRTRIATPDFAAGLALVTAIGAAAEELDHHPDLDLRYTWLDVRLHSHDVGRVTGRDLRLARRITEIAAAAGRRTEGATVTTLELALDSPDHERIRPFWAAMLDMAPAGDDELRDERADWASMWFQKSGDAEPRQRWHPDVWVDPAVARGRIDAAVAAGGTLVSDADAPNFWVLADPDGNRVCVCTWQDRA